MVSNLGGGNTVRMRLRLVDFRFVVAKLNAVSLLDKRLRGQITAGLLLSPINIAVSASVPPDSRALVTKKLRKPCGATCRIPTATQAVVRHERIADWSRGTFELNGDGNSKSV